MTHTPIPWTTSGTTTWAIYGPNGESVLSKKCSAKGYNARFIVECVNNYAALKKSHADLLKELRYCHDKLMEIDPLRRSDRDCGTCEVISAAEQLEEK